MMKRTITMMSTTSSVAEITEHRGVPSSGTKWRRLGYLFENLGCPILGSTGNISTGDGLWGGESCESVKSQQLTLLLYSS
jgi:hypothetical protein